MKTLPPLLFLLFVFGSISFIEPFNPTVPSDSYWVRYCNDSYDCGYLNTKGDTMIPAGKYSICFTDTFRSYAVVNIIGKGFVAINKQEKVLYKVFAFDNGPDPVSEGRFRIIKNGLIGFADERTGKVMIYPQYKCAFPYENSVSEVSFDCEQIIEPGGEHTSWTGGKWFYIDHAGKIAPPPEH